MIYIRLDGNDFYSIETDERGEYERKVTTFDLFNNAGGGFVWGLSVKETARSRKWKPVSGTTHSLHAQIDRIRQGLLSGEWYEIMAHTPRIKIVFFKDWS